MQSFEITNSSGVDVLVGGVATNGWDSTGNVRVAASYGGKNNAKASTQFTIDSSSSHMIDRIDVLPCVPCFVLFALALLWQRRRNAAADAGGAGAGGRCVSARCVFSVREEGPDKGEGRNGCGPNRRRHNPPPPSTANRLVGGV